MSSTLDTRIHTPCVPVNDDNLRTTFFRIKIVEIINNYLNATRYVHVCTQYLRFHKLFEQKRRRLTFSATETPIRFVQITRVPCVESPPFHFGSGNGNLGLDDEERVRGEGSVHRKAFKRENRLRVTPVEANKSRKLGLSLETSTDGARI